MPEKQLFPSYRYHRDLAPAGVLVESQAEADALGEGYSDSYDFTEQPAIAEPGEQLTPAQKAAATRARKAAEAAAAAEPAKD